MQITGTKDFLFEVQKKKKTLASDANLVKGQVLEDRKNVLDLKILVGVDVSGSISEKQFKRFMQALDAIKGLSVVMVIEIDSEIVSIYNYFKLQGKESRIIRLGGGGGTEFTPFFQKAKEMKPDAIILMTDGDVFGPVRDPGIPTGYILTHGGHKPYSFGDVISELPD